MRATSSLLAPCIAATGLLLFAVGLAGAAGTPEQKCQAIKNREAGRYAFCLQKAEAKLATSGDTVKYGEALAKCLERVDVKWGKADVKAAEAGASCLDTLNGLVVADFGQLIDRQAAAFATALGGGGLVRYAFPATGQTTAYGTYSDGNMLAGAALRYRDNGDGTITDENTGLMWEKKSDDGSIHDADNLYTWGMMTPPYAMDGTIVTSLLAALNGGAGFAGHADWRIPNVKELHSIVNFEIPYPGPAVESEFNTDCDPGCAVMTCSCTAVDLPYWSSTTSAYSGFDAWYVEFYGGSAFGSHKSDSFHVRAVRGGS